MVWSPGSRIVFRSTRGGSGQRKPSNGQGEDTLLLKNDFNKVPTDWSRDGRYSLIRVRTDLGHCGAATFGGLSRSRRAQLGTATSMI